jgi:hypothetical protein
MRMNRQDFILAVGEAAPDITFTVGPDDRYIHLSRPVEMLCGDGGQTEFVVGYNCGAHFQFPVRTISGTATSCKPLKPKSTRLLTPAECAGKWLVQLNDRHRSLVIFFDESSIKTAAMHGMIETLHSTGWKIADTPTSTPYSLKVEIANQ